MGKMVLCILGYLWLTLRVWKKLLKIKHILKKIVHTSICSCTLIFQNQPSFKLWLFFKYSGRKYVCGKVGKITLEKIWSKTTQKFALQTTRKDILIHDSSFTQYRTLPELYPDGSTCFVIAYALYGCQAEVITIDKEHRGRIQLSVIEPTVR